MRYLLYILTALILTGCITERQAARRINKYVGMFPGLRDTVKVTVHDTIIMPGDTVFRPVLLRRTDTVVVENERQSVRIVRIPTGSPCDTAVFRAEVLATVKPDTVIVTNTVEVPRIVPGKAGIADWWRTVAIVLLLLVALFIATRPRR